MKCKNAKQNSSTDKSDPHWSGLSSRDQNTTAESPNTDLSTLLSVHKEKPPISNIGIEDQFEHLVYEELESLCEENSCKDKVSTEPCSGDECYKTTGDAVTEHKEEEILEPSTKLVQDENMDTLMETLLVPFTDSQLSRTRLIRK